MIYVKYRMYSAMFTNSNPALHLIKITMRHNTRIKSSSRTFVFLVANRCILRSEKLIFSFASAANLSQKFLDYIFTRTLFSKNKNITFAIYMYILRTVFRVNRLMVIEQKFFSNFHYIKI